MKRAGVDRVAHANNHAFDYGSIGILETLANVEAAGLVLAGAGKDLQDARAPRHFASGGGRVALVDGKPIFYGLGDLVFEVESISRFPSEAYEQFGLGDEASADDLLRARREISPSAGRRAYEGCAAVLRFRDRRLAEIRLLPLDLQFDAPKPDRGRPRWADPELARDIIERVAERSKPHGTKVRFDAAGKRGLVEIP